MNPSEQGDINSAATCGLAANQARTARSIWKWLFLLMEAPGRPRPAGNCHDRAVAKSVVQRLKRLASAEKSIWLKDAADQNELDHIEILWPPPCKRRRNWILLPVEFKNDGPGWKSVASGQPGAIQGWDERPSPILGLDQLNPA